MDHTSTHNPLYQVYDNSNSAWEAMLAAITNAKHSIYWEMYILVDDEAGKPFLDILQQKAKEGVTVKLLIDGFGSFAMPHKRIESLINAGVDVRIFHERKHRYRGLWSKMISRTHRKILVVDEHIGFIGGVNVQKHMQDWLDIHVRITGKPVRSMLRAFAKMYLIAGGEKKEVKQLLKYTFRVKGNSTEFIYDEPGRYKKGARMRKVYTDALLKARERVILFSPYYFPDKRFLRALWQAKKRGVRVDLLIPFRADVRLATYLAYGVFAITNKMGVNIHLLPKMMHGKGMVVDDEYAVIGSSNIEQGSLYDNYEANVKIGDKRVIKKLYVILNRWQSEAKLLKAEEWKKRSALTKIKEWLVLRLYKLWHPRAK